MLRHSAYHAVRRLAPETTSLMSFNQARPWGSVPFRACPYGNHHRLSTAISPRAISEPVMRAPLSTLRSKKQPVSPDANLSTPLSQPASVGTPSNAFSYERRIFRFRFIDRVSAIPAHRPAGHVASLQGFQPSAGWDLTWGFPSFQNPGSPGFFPP